MKALLARLAEATGDPAELEDLRALQLVVQQHVTVEEGELFPAYRLLAGTDALAQLDQAAGEARAKAPPPSTSSLTTSDQTGEAR